VTAQYVIGCDVGSQGTNAALYAEDGRLVASHYEPHDLLYSRPTWAEQDPRQWIAALRTAVGALVSELPDPRAVRGISFGSQLDGLVACDENGEPVRPAIIWMDRRAEAQARKLAKLVSREQFYRLSGANLDSSHAVFKALWIRDEEPENFERAVKFMPPGSYVLQELTGECAVDYSNASSLALLDPNTRKWSDELLRVTGLDAAQLPALAAATDPASNVTSAFADATGLDASTVVAVGCGDEMAATLGAGVFEPGDVCDVVGTAEPVCAASADPRFDPTMLVECHPHADPDAWLLENPGFVSGGNLRWWRDHFAPEERAAEERGAGDAYDLLAGAAAEVNPGSDGVVFLPCMQGAMAPEWNGAARGVFYGLTLAHTRAHMTRAMLEGSAFALRDIIEAMKNAGLGVRRLTIVGGGAKGDLWSQIKADVTGLPVRIPTNVETTATGAAMLAAVAAGIFGSVAEASSSFVSFRPQGFEPDDTRQAAYDEVYGLYGDLYGSLKDVFARGEEKESRAAE
jgi:xylulokinase